MNRNTYALVIHYDKSVDSIRFFVRLKNGDRKTITADEPLKGFENTGAVFSLKDHFDLGYVTTDS